MKNKHTSSVSEMIDFAHELARLSGEAILPHFRQSIGYDNKIGPTGFDPVTAADRAAEDVIRASLAGRYPDHGIIGEEYGSHAAGAETQWIIDPIDGTRSFMMGLHTWGTLIGIRQHGRAVGGVMNQPFTGERFWADDKAAYYSGPGGDRTLKTRECASLEHAILGATAPEIFREPAQWEAFARVRSKVRMTRFGGDCLGYCLLAMGQIDLIIEANLQVYDIAALVPIIERAGGVITTWDGGDAQHGGHVVAAGDPKLHEAALRLIND